ncbi:putative aldehyde dehydrogenase (NAD+) [Caenispirillum salinarum AK4]|uniref:Putative aldehyde dehydrogenase (NAD+) n=1 Tax=Caenispirillum salinarum AK4 TaxID=1238182 RepID=K9GTX1_9PROT|nr:aldehyde dehydrogenase family protein [Caenispirillum salinarum]EKV28169.1 putative aldehyde dehydrogenase (NAD+) [Caenispirillum salinarum AK4]
MRDDDNRDARADASDADAATATARRVAAARAAQGLWGRTPLRRRLKVIRRLRRMIGRRATDLAGAVRTYGGRQPGETLMAEVLPLAEACRFLEREAGDLLAPRKLGGEGRPAWLSGTSAVVTPEPLGVVLILAPSNYPLMLPGIQIVQALVAGNAVVVKPAPQCAAPLYKLAAMLDHAGLPEGLLHVLGETVAEAEAAMDAGVDKVLLTGSAETGKAVQRRLAETLTPATMELSGSDAVVVLPRADLDLVARSVAYGLRLNGGATCIAPRRVFVPREAAAALERKLLYEIASIPAVPVPLPVRRQLHDLVRQAESDGARLAHGTFDPAEGALKPVVVADAAPWMGLLQADVFAPVVSLVPVADTQAAVEQANECPYGLGATVFGPEKAAREVAEALRVGGVTINDIIVPTADPRLPFGGRGRSGFGVTRGTEGLLELTHPKVISTRKGRFRPHLRPPSEADAKLAAGWLRLVHGGLGGLFRGRRP